MEKFKIKRTAGENLEQIIAQTLVKSPIVAIKELVSNSYDADSELVNIKLEHDIGRLLIEDDGEGMTENGLISFKRMGDSLKLKNPVTKKGRSCIGQFGIATALLGFLGNSYDIETWTPESYIEGHEDFESGLGLEYNVHQNPTGKHGTKMIIHNVRALREGTLSHRRLVNPLTWEMPNQQDLEQNDRFTIYLDGKLLVRKNSKPLQEFQFKDTIDGLGNISMHLDYFDKTPIFSGVYLYVNNRAIGSGNFIDLRRYKGSLSGKVYARIDADSLRTEILFDREEIREDSPKFKSLSNWTHKNLLEVRRAVESGKIRIKTMPQIVPSLSYIKKTFQDVGFLPGQNKEDTKTTDNSVRIQKNYTKSNEKRNICVDDTPKLIPTGSDRASVVFRGLHTVKKGPINQHIEINHVTQEVYFNIDHPLYSSPEITSSELMRMHILLGSCFTFPSSEAVSDSYRTDFNDICVKLLSPLSTLELARDRVSRIHSENQFIPSKRYETGEVLGLLGINLSTLRKLVYSGVLNPVTEDKFLGSELNDYMNISTNYTPACMVMEEYAKRRNVSRQRVNQLTEKINDLLINYQDSLPFLINIGKTNPFILIPNENVPGFQGLYSQGVIREPHLNESYDNIIRKNKLLFDRTIGTTKREYVSFEDLCSSSRLTPTQILKVLGYSQRKGGRLSMKFEDNRMFFSYEDFQKIKQRYLVDEKR
jgi:hypothetical protein